MRRSINAGSLVIPINPDAHGVRPYGLPMGLLFVTAMIALLKPGHRERPSALPRPG
jgi:hypothetical protein